MTYPPVSSSQEEGNQNVASPSNNTSAPATATPNTTLSLSSEEGRTRAELLLCRARVFKQLQAIGRCIMRAKIEELDCFAVKKPTDRFVKQLTTYNDPFKDLQRGTIWEVFYCLIMEFLSKSDTFAKNNQRNIFIHVFEVLAQASNDDEFEAAKKEAIESITNPTLFFHLLVRALAVRYVACNIIILAPSNYLSLPRHLIAFLLHDAIEGFMLNFDSFTCIEPGALHYPTINSPLPVVDNAGKKYNVAFATSAGSTPPALEAGATTYLTTIGASDFTSLQAVTDRLAPFLEYAGQRRDRPQQAECEGFPVSFPLNSPPVNEYAFSNICAFCSLAKLSPNKPSKGADGRNRTPRFETHGMGSCSLFKITGISARGVIGHIVRTPAFALPPNAIEGPDEKVLTQFPVGSECLLKLPLKQS